ncbi:hypothetical protein CI238_00748 [Colletotrichum incanum]|uniref:Uncharacterized protein n=1 Tax=Colletotrichum incanum TaxID=1573173 RepID=A0A161VHR7_COLIC|nr:hypothetical protein CI238_00748 [Colletotrichum incanum]
MEIIKHWSFLHVLLLYRFKVIDNIIRKIATIWYNLHKTSSTFAFVVAMAAIAFAAPEAVKVRQAASCQPQETVCRDGWAWCCSGSTCYEFAPPTAC